MKSQRNYDKLLRPCVRSATTATSLRTTCDGSEWFKMPVQVTAVAVIIDSSNRGEPKIFSQMLENCDRESLEIRDVQPRFGLGLGPVQA